jgi:uncharacterized membrane protein
MWASFKSAVTGTLGQTALGAIIGFAFYEGGKWLFTSVLAPRAVAAVKEIKKKAKKEKASAATA